jgi:hypothetical protein
MQDEYRYVPGCSEYQIPFMFAVFSMFVLILFIGKLPKNGIQIISKVMKRK